MNDLPYKIHQLSRPTEVKHLREPIVIHERAGSIYWGGSGVIPPMHNKNRVCGCEVQACIILVHFIFLCSRLE